MKKSISWQAHSGQNRVEIIEEVKNAISMADGDIMDFKMFSDLALSLSIEIEENRIEHLHKLLSSLLSVSELNTQEISQKSKKEWRLFISISFAQGKGNLKNEVPDVPG